MGCSFWGHVSLSCSNCYRMALLSAISLGLSHSLNIQFQLQIGDAATFSVREKISVCHGFYNY